MTETPDRTESIFAAAVALATAEERAAYLDQAWRRPGSPGTCRGPARAHDRAGHLLDRPVPGGVEQTAAYVPSEQPGTVVAGRYKLLEAIGEGGMGTVWVAEQTQPVRRKVALKLIKPGMDSKSVLARFEAERQALAVMDHPNIAKVLDGGLTESGRPFFVMEYVKGVPITEYCDAARLSVPERLQLFVQVCQAVQHAHQKGIIHRDLKPSNILVAPYDDRPVPKVIDFGLAKAMHQPLTEQTLHTAHETVLGTPLYMSPEQAQLNNLDVDTRSDLYSLGVLLYELLTGTTPLEKQRFKEAAWDEIRRIIREEEPPRPSTRLSSSQALPSLAAGRQTEPARLTKLVRGELDWIVMKALEKDRTRRYETANGFALDIQRYLAGEPVLAAPPSARYRLRKFVRKHRAALTTAAAVIVLLLAGVAFSTWQAVRATRAEAAARAAEQRAKVKEQPTAERQRSRAEARGRGRSRRRAGPRRAKSWRANGWCRSRRRRRKRRRRSRSPSRCRTSCRTSCSVRPTRGAQADSLLRAGGLSAEAKENPTIRELLDRAAKELGAGKDRRELPEPTTGPGGDPANGRQYLSQCGRVRTGDRIPATLRGSASAKPRPRQSRQLTSMNNLAVAYWAAGKLDLAMPLFEETLKLQKAKFGPDHPDTFICMNDLAMSRIWLPGSRTGPAALEETLKLRKAKLGPDHPDTLPAWATSRRVSGSREAGLGPAALRGALKVRTRSSASDIPTH